MGITRIVNTAFWTDETVVDYYSPEDKYFMLYLMTNPHTRQLGIYKLPKKIMAFEMGYSVDTVQVLLDRFESKYRVIRYSESTQEVAILNYLKHSIVKGGKPVVDCIAKDLSQVTDKTLIKSVYKKVIKFEDKRDTMTTIIEMLSVYENDISNDNDNDNDNDSIVPRFVPRFDTESETKPKKQVFGTFNNVKLTQTEYQKLVDEYGQGSADKAIEYLSAYREEKGYKNKSDYLSLKRWVFDAAEKKSKSANPFKDYYLKEIENEQNRSGLPNGDHQDLLPRILPPGCGD